MKTLKPVSLFYFPALEVPFLEHSQLEIANLEFKSHDFLENHVFLPTKQSRTDICMLNGLSRHEF